MQHRDRQQLLTGIAQVVEELCGIPPTAALESQLQQRLTAPLNHFLLEAQPIICTEVTILIVDLRGFTALMESFPAPVMIEVLNRFYGLMAQLVAQHGGVVDKFMGDAVMALFGIPEPQPDDLLRALTCAVKMQQAIAEMNWRSAERGTPNLYAGIGISTGEVMVGSFGSDVYSEYTVIGDPVNVAARIEGYSLRGQVLISTASYQRAKDQIKIGAVNDVMVKGKTNPVTLYELKAVTAPQMLLVPEIEVRKSPRIVVDFPIVFRKVEAKKVLTERFIGKVNDLSYDGMSADLPLILPPYSEILMSLMPDLGAEAPLEVYARVLRTRGSQNSYRTSLQFTAVDTPAHRKVKQYVDQMLWGR
jgi:adenylate cyclase